MISQSALRANGTRNAKDGRYGAILGSPSLAIQDRLTSEDGKGVLVTGVAEGDASSGSNLEVVNLLLGDVEGDGHGEEGAIGETEGGEDAAKWASERMQGTTRASKNVRLVVGLSHESLEGRETSVEDELEVTKLALRQANVGQRVGLLKESIVEGKVANVKVLEDSAMGCVGLQKSRQDEKRAVEKERR